MKANCTNFAATALALLSIVICSSMDGWSASTQMTDVPTGSKPAIDGVISPGEWNDAGDFHLAGGGELRIKRDAKYLYLALSGVANGFAQIYLAYGDTIRVLHASAALGEIRYHREKGGS